MAQSRFAQIREHAMQSAEFRERYERSRRMLEASQEILRTIDARRETAGLSKAEFARRLGTRPASVRRLLSSGSGSGNPTLRTVLEMLDELGLEIRLESRSSERADSRSENGDTNSNASIELAQPLTQR